jgi:thiol-disulfide isomerase/thioredoxin
MNRDGTPFNPSQIRGKRVILNFWAVWCLPCRQEIPVLEKFAAKVKGQGIEVILVNMGDSNEAIDRFLKMVPTNLRVVSLPENALRSGPWSVAALPATVLLDGMTVPRWRALGRIDNRASEALILRRLTQMASGAK